MTRTILAFCDWFLPGHKAGGPVRTLWNMTRRLAPDLRFRIVTRDRDLGDEAPYPGVAIGSWTMVGDVDVLYLPRRDQRPGRFIDIVRDAGADVLYLNSVFSRRFTLLPLVARRLVTPHLPLVVAPRGELASAALALRARSKAVYLAALKASGLVADAVWQASSPHEADDVRRAIGRRADVRTAADLAAPVPPAPAPRSAAKRRGGARVVFLGRISPMKNLDGLLRILRDGPAGVTLAIHGPIEDVSYWAGCRRLIEALPDGVRADHHGSVTPDAVPSLLASADALVLPSHGENFGHVVAEALAAACPVLVSDRTPWGCVATAGAGWLLAPDDANAWHVALAALVGMAEADHAVMRRSAHTLARSRDADPTDLAANRSLFSIDPSGSGQCAR